MTIYAALGHRISVLEKEKDALEAKRTIAKETLREVILTFERFSRECPEAKQRYAEILEQAKQTLDEIKAEEPSVKLHRERT